VLKKFDYKVAGLLGVLVLGLCVCQLITSDMCIRDFHWWVNETFIFYYFWKTLSNFVILWIYLFYGINIVIYYGVHVFVLKTGYNMRRQWWLHLTVYMVSPILGSNGLFLWNLRAHGNNSGWHIGWYIAGAMCCLTSKFTPLLPINGGARTNMGGAICQWKPYVLRSSRN
jgi:hypothetical protein